MKKSMVAIVAVLGLVAFSGPSFADEKGGMKDMKDMKSGK